jgi:hypothetical protein
MSFLPLLRPCIMMELVSLRRAGERRARCIEPGERPQGRHGRRAQRRRARTDLGGAAGGRARGPPAAAGASSTAVRAARDAHLSTIGHSALRKRRFW